MNEQTSDVAILGGGLAGLSLALQLRQKLPKAEITILEKRQHPVPEAAHKVGESTVEVAAHYFANVLGVKEHILERQLPKLGLRFFFPAGDNSRIEQRLELGGKRFAPCPSYQLDRGRFENHLGDLCLARGIRFIDQSKVQDVHVEERGMHRVDYELDKEQRSVWTRWLVDASGRRAFVKRKLGLQKPSPHKANAAWFRFKKHLRIDDWSNSADWQAGHEGKTARFYSTNHLMGEGYWVWMIPLASGSTSLGIVAGEDYHSLSDFNSFEKAVRWLETHEPQCAEVVKQNIDELQDFRAIKHYATECEQVFSPNRWGITGEAGFFHDPFYSPGSDFIAFSNTFLTDLIWRDLTGRRFRFRANSYDRIYKRFYYGTLAAYSNQYGLFGNPTVMPVKILWDYLVYWSITAFIFMHDRLCQQSAYLFNLRHLSQFGKLNHFMQDFFRQWNEETRTKPLTGLVNISEVPIIREMNQRLKDEMSWFEFNKQFAANLYQLQTLAAEIVEQSGINVAFPFPLKRGPRIKTNSFENVFAGMRPATFADDQLATVSS